MTIRDKLRGFLKQAERPTEELTEEQYNTIEEAHDNLYDLLENEDLPQETEKRLRKATSETFQVLFRWEAKFNWNDNE